LVALSQFLPGAATSQIGMGVGLLMAGIPGALIAWTAFTLPSALILMACGYAFILYDPSIVTAKLHGLKIVTVAIVAQALIHMVVTFCPDKPRKIWAIIATIFIFLWPYAYSQIAVIVFSSFAGILFFKQTSFNKVPPFQAIPVTLRTSLTALGLFGFFLILSSIFSFLSSSHFWELVSSFYRTGSFVFGGGHVVLPLLKASVVDKGWISMDLFLAGYGAAQAIPGPMFTFATYLGVVMRPEPSGWLGGIICLFSLYAPSFLLLVAIFPYWDMFRNVKGIQSAISGINAGVVGILLATLCHPIITSSILSWMDLFIALFVFLMLQFGKVPPWVVVIIGILIGTTL
jgi:chromate transporter